MAPNNETEEERLEQTECEFLNRDLLRLWKTGDKTDDQTYQLPIQFWCLDMIQQSIMLGINRSILEQ